MIKLLIAGRRCHGKDRATALRHLRTVHGPLVYKAPADAGEMPARYVQNHVFDGSDVAALRPYRSDRDLVTEIWFKDFARLGAATQTPYYKNVLQPDESNFVDQASVLRTIVRERTIREASLPAAAKLFLFLKRKSGMDLAVFVERCEAAVAAASGAGESIAGHAVNTPLPPPGGGEPFTDQVQEFWFAHHNGAEQFHDGALPGLLTALEDALDQGSTFYVLADEYHVARLKISQAIPA